MASSPKAGPDPDADDSSESIPLLNAPSSSGVNRRLYISHFLSTWNSRVFEFGAVLFIAAVFPRDLRPPSVYALLRAAAAIAFSPAVGRYVDAADRLEVVRFSIVVQRAVVVASCLGFWALMTMRGRTDVPAALRPLILLLLACFACVEKLCSIMNLVAVERDWVVVISKHTGSDLGLLNSQMRRIDLVCKLAGPLFIALLDGISTPMAIWLTLGTNAASAMVEYFAIAKVYKLVPALQVPRTSSSAADATLPGRPTSWARDLHNSVALYIHHPVFIPSFALSLLYFTVLNFAGQMVVYFLSVGYTSSQIGLVRTASVMFEVSATWLAPRAMRAVGPTRAALWFINWQAVCLVAVVAVFCGGTQLAAAGLAGGVIASRIGLWGFDLCVQILIQEEVDAATRGVFSAVEASLQNTFELCAYASTIVFASPQQFVVPVLLSALAVCVAAAAYARFVRIRRGHVLHVADFVIKMRGRRDALVWR